MVGAGVALASRVRECHDAGGRWDPCSPHLTVTSCWSDQQTAFAYVKNTHRSRVSYSPRQHLRLPGARSQGWVSSEARECSGARGDPDTCAGAGASRTGWCWALRAPSLVRRGSRVGVRDTPVPGQSRHSRVPSTHVAPAAHGRAPERLPAPQLHIATPAQAPGERQGRESLESGRGDRAPDHPRSGLLLSLPCCAPAPDPTEPPPTLCLLQTIVLHLHQLSPRSVRRCRGTGEAGLSGPWR